MIEQRSFLLKPEDGTPLPREWAYRLYGWLMEQLPAELGDSLHEQGEHPIAQYLHFSQEHQAMLWTVSLMGEETCREILPVLEKTRRIRLHELSLEASPAGQKSAVSAEELIRAGRECDAGCSRITFLSPCSFRQAGRYAIFPQESLLLQSLVQRWNSVFPDLALTDPDALHTMEQGLHLVGYSLRTTRYSLKNTRIPAFTGNITVEARLALPLLELWNTLLAFAPYAGIGIKTTLGMGGAEVIFLPRRESRGTD